MTRQDLKLMSAEELWLLHEQVTSVLAKKIAAEKVQLDRRLQQLGLGPSASAKKMNHARRPYPRVFPKYRNPGETWAGRGKQPRWLSAQLKSGKKLEDFRIQSPSNRARRSVRK
jgi:DNA-binding protein H-NS